MTEPQAASPARVRILHPPAGAGRFWAVQVAVAVIAATHLVADLRSSVETGAFPAGLPVALLIVPVGYSALRWGLAGSAPTGLWATLLWLPDLLLPPDRGHLGADLVDLALIDAVAVFVGWQIDAERAARQRLVQATQARAEAERRALRYAALVVDTEEDQRRQLARELHDEPLQLFLHLARRLESLGEDARMPAYASAELRDAGGQALEAAGRLRTMARDLRPPALDQLGLVAALTSLVDEAEERSGTPADLRVTGPACRLAPDLELGAFRIAQEAVRNGLNHARPGCLRVGVDFGPDVVTLEVVDDGGGFDPGAEAGGGAHLGLLGMAERAHLLGGRLEVVSRPDRGTTVRAVLPTAGPRADDGSPFPTRTRSGALGTSGPGRTAGATQTVATYKP